MTALRALGKRLYKGRWGYFFILPNFAIFAIFFLVPVVWSMVLSLLDYQWWGTEFVGLRNYQSLLGDRIFWKSIVNTAYYTLGVITAVVSQGPIGFSTDLSFQNQSKRSLGRFLSSPLHQQSSSP